MPSPENINEQKTQSKKVSSEDYNLLLSGRSVMGPSFNLTPPIINFHDDEIDDNVSENEIMDIFYCIDIVDKDRKSDYTSKINEYYNKLMLEAKTSNNKKKQKIFVDAMGCCIIEAEEYQVNGKFRQALSQYFQFYPKKKDAQIEVPDNSKLEIHTYQIFFILSMLNYIWNPLVIIKLQTQQKKQFNQMKVYNFMSTQLIRSYGLVKYIIYFVNFHHIEAYYEDSKKLFVHCLSIYDNYIDKDDPRVAHIYNQMGIMCFMKEDYFHADKYFSMSIDILKDIQGYDQLKIQTYNGMGIVSQMQSINEHGLTYFNKALEISDTCQISKAKILSNIGNVRKLKGNLKDSISIFQQAIEIFSKVLPTWHASYKKIEKTNQNLIQTLKQQHKSL